MKFVFSTVILSAALLGLMPGCRPEESVKLDEWVETVKARVNRTVEKDPSRASSKQEGADKQSFASRYEAAQSRAVSEFPELGVAGSPFNVEFLARVKMLKTEDIKYFNNPEWPYDLAKRVSEIIKSRGVDANTISSVLISQRPSLYLDQWILVSGTVVKVNGLSSLSLPVSVDLEGGVKVEISPEQFIRKRSGSITDWNEQNYKIETKNGAVVFLMREGKGDMGRASGWNELFALTPGTSLIVKGQVTRSGDRLVMKAAKLLAYSEVR